MPINGSDKFRFRILDPSPGGRSEIVDFSFNYTALYEIDVGEATMHEYDDGSKAKIFHFLNLKWIIDWSGIFETPDGMLVQKIKRAEREGKELWLTPHIDIEDREFRVLILEEERTLGEYYNEEHEGPNKDYVMTLVNADRVIDEGWVEPGTVGIGIGGSHQLPRKGQVET